VGLIAGESLANNLKVGPVVAMWATDVIFGLVGIGLMLGMSRYAGGARGAGFGEVVQRLRFWRARRATLSAPA